MSKIDLPGREDREFSDGYLREFDMALLTMHPAQRPGYLESAYVQTMECCFEAVFLREMAKMLLKWGTEKHSFVAHARKLLKRAEKIEEGGGDIGQQHALPGAELPSLRGSSHALVENVLASPPMPLTNSEKE